MAASFASASSQRLVNAAPSVITFPFTVGLWAYPTTAGAIRNFFSLGDTAVSTHYFALGQNSTDVWRISASDGTNTNALTGTVTLNKWAFLIGRWISATSRRLSVLQYDGSIANNVNSVSRSPASVDTMFLGARVAATPTEFFDGLLGEFWYTATDIQPDGAALQAPIVRQLAYGGPFSVPHIAKDIIEYRSLRKDPLAGNRDDLFVGAGKPVQVWSNTNGVTVGSHPPLPGWYAKPTQTRRAMVPI